MLILLAHGSVKQEWRDSVESLLSSVQEVAGEKAVRLAYMDHATPSLMDCLEAVVEEGVTRFRVLPLFLTGEGHVTRDIGPMVDLARARFRSIEVELLPAVGEHPLFSDLIIEIMRESSQ